MDHHGSVRRLWTIFSYSQRAGEVSNNVVFAFAAVGAVSGLASAFILPWFPNVCREQGLSRWQTGVIFAAMDGTMLLCRWPFVELCRRRGIRSFYLFGFVIQAGACFGLGWVWTIKSTSFFATCLIFRVVQGIGASMVSAASLQVINTLVYLRVDSIGVCMESVLGLSRVFGAPFGAVVYHAFGGGHVALKMAFWFLAAMFGTTAVLASGTIRLPIEPPTIREREPGSPTAWAEMLGSRAIVISLLLIFLVDMVYSLLEPTLSIHLFESFDMDTFQRGVLFMEMGIFGLIAAPVSSLIGEYTSRKIVMTIGCALTGMALIGLGHGSDPQMGSAFAVMLGISLSMIATPAVPAMLWDVPQDSALTDGEVAYVTNGLGAVAAVVGPIYGAGLAQKIDFKGMALCTAGILWALAGILMASFLCGCLRWRNVLSHDDQTEQEELTKKPLLQSQTDHHQDRPAAIETKDDSEGSSWLPSFGGSSSTPKAAEATEADKATS